MKIRNIEPKDFEAWRPLWKGYQDYYEVNLDATTDNTWQRLLDPAPDGPFCLVCEDNEGELIGFTTYVFHGHTWQPEPRCYLIDLFTTKSLRGKGIGRALIEAVYEKADQHGSSQVYWMTQDSNEAARKLYDKVGKLTPFVKYRR